MEPFVLPKQLLLLTLNTVVTWGILEKGRQMGVANASAVKPPSAFSLSTQLLALVYIDIR